MAATVKKAKKAIPAPTPPYVSPFTLPAWAPYVVGALGVAVVVLILLTAKGRD